MVVAPHHLAAQVGLDVLRDGGNAIEAMVAAASTIAVVYPHMNALGGDNFWLIDAGDGAPIGIDACGAAAARATVELYRDRGFAKIPSRGPLAANTVAGAVSGWDAALEVSARWGGRLPLSRLLEDAARIGSLGRQYLHARHQLSIADHPRHPRSLGCRYRLERRLRGPPPRALDRCSHSSVLGRQRP